MNGDLKIDELWSLKLKPSDLYNIERWPSDKPATGGGHTYIQVPKRLVADVLAFLREAYPDKGVPVILEVNNRARPDLEAERLEFWEKSSGRMRIARQNRHGQARLRAWSPEMGFPSLEQYQDTGDAATLLDSIGGLHIYLARAADGTVWAGYTVGNPSEADSQLPFADILWGDSPGGYWRYEAPTK
ncbi:MAG: hypothetical protein DMF63_06415 [Acidobacteria bacterium]|nr:MAG: hypothetical protein DMF63_06415 [Acidobacteriota bacterium]